MPPTICLMLFPKDFYVESPLNFAFYSLLLYDAFLDLFEKKPLFSMQTGIINTRFMFSKKGISIVYCDLLLRMKSFCSKASRTWIDMEKEGVANSTILPSNCTSQVYLPSLFDNNKAYPNGFNIQIVDDDNWQISSGLYRAWQRPEVNSSLNEGVYYSHSLCDEAIHRDCDDIDDMRIRGNLFYKLDRHSKEYEEYSFDFHRKKKPSTKEDNSNHQKKHSLAQNPEKETPPTKENNSKHQKKHPLTNNPEKETRNRFVIPETANGSCLDEKKRLRTPTFNQVTGPYHEPFCLDIYVSKASVRACIVHRLTSKVVAVAHSISKDMKFDLVSRRDLNACAAVGKVLAQRALTDDIHNLIYTPRKGERIEGKLQTVLQSVINGGINVKVKIKQRIQKKASHPSMAMPNKQ